MALSMGLLGAAGAPAGAFELISTQVLTSSASSVTFSSIPATYKHLQLRMVARHQDSGNLFTRIAVRLNSVASASYSSHELAAVSTTPTSVSAISQTFLWAGTVIRNTQTSGAFTASVCDILDYADTSKNTTTRTLTGGHHGGTNGLHLQSGAFLDTSAISLIQLFPANGSGFLTGSRFSLYGIKG